jgi:hypothetical protein
MQAMQCITHRDCDEMQHMQCMLDACAKLPGPCLLHVCGASEHPHMQPVRSTQMHVLQPSGVSVAVQLRVSRSVADQCLGGGRHRRKC